MVNYLMDKRLPQLKNLRPKKDFQPLIAKRQLTLINNKSNDAIYE